MQYRKIVLFFIFVVSLASASCKKSVPQGGGSADGIANYQGDTFDGVTYITPEVVKAAFELDYRPLYPEEAQPFTALSASTLWGAARSRTQETQIAGGGLRKLSEYKTAYFDAKTEAERIKRIQEAQNKDYAALTQNKQNSKEPFTVIESGPTGFFSAAVQHPSVYVIFSEAVVPLQALGEQKSTSDIMSITPPLKGTFRWYGTAFLSFEADEPCQAQQIYTVTVAATAKSIFGKTISGTRTFSFYTEAIQITGIEPSANSVITPNDAKRITVNFNYPVSADDIRQYIEVNQYASGSSGRPDTRSKSAKAFTLTQGAGVDGGKKLIVSISDKIDFESFLGITLKKGAKSRSGTLGTESDREMLLSTPTKFTVTDGRRERSYGRYRNLVNISFSHNVDISSIKGALRTAPAMTIADSNIEIWGSTVRLSNLPVGYGDKFSVTVGTAVKDIYGRSLSEPFTFQIEMPKEPPANGYVNFLDYGYKMLEAKYAQKFLFEYRNVAAGSYYTVAKKNNPWNSFTEKSSTKEVTSPEKNYRYFEEINLKDYLNSEGKGFVQFYAKMQLPYTEDDGKISMEKSENTLNVQVTDLGITSRFAFNKAVVLVTKLSDGTAVEGATVKLLPPKYFGYRNDIYGDAKDFQNIDSIENFGEAVTDKNGFATIALPSGSYRANVGSRYSGSAYVFVKKADDRAIFEPHSHNTWAFDVSSRQPSSAEEIRPVTFLFSDRGLYKPGETVTFRGVDRDLILGMYATYKGGYKVTLEDNGYNSSAIATVSGEVSESGGFYGSFKLSDELDPGTYRIVYSRGSSNENKYSRASAPIEVAYFERLKFQAFVAPPTGVTIYAADDISMGLSASYLSGGSLSGASWSSAWYRQLSYFNPKTPAAKGFSFGPNRAYDGKRYIAAENGKLSGDGIARLSQKTENPAVVGAPYRYSVEASVTDISNQEITASASVLVHPAQFYLGLMRGGSGFAKTGAETSFDYIALNPDGEKITSASLFLQSGDAAKKITAELIRYEWNRVQQQGVNGYIYDQYVESQVVESTQTLAAAFSGTIKMRPAKSGYHLLRITAKDRDGKTALTELSFYVTGGQGGYWNMSSAEEIKLTPDQALYNPGDKAQILLQSALPKGLYLITVERDGIFNEEVRALDESSTVLEVPIARNYVPVVYVSVASYSVRTSEPSHTYGSADLDKPKGYYGVAKISVNPRVKAFSVKIDNDKKSYKPGEEVTVTLTATHGGTPVADAELTLMAVDRGVLDLINYHVPDPIDYFYDEYRFPLYVTGGDSRAMLMDPVTYSVKNLSGGDGDESKMEERKDFNPTAVFEPMLKTDAKGQVKHTFKLPDTLTTYRVTVFGIRGDIFALQESEIVSQNKINVREVLPRRIRERDTAEAGVLITNLDEAAHTLTIKLAIGSLRSDAAAKQLAEESGVTKIAGEAFIDGTSERKITVKSGENAVAYFDVAGVKEGFVTLNWTVTSDILNERIVNELQIEHPYIMESVTTTGSIPDKTASGTEGIVLPSFADNNTGSLSLTLDATRLSLLGSAVNYLFRYPFGCMEQRSAAMMPLVIFGDYIDAFGMSSEVANPKRVVEAEFKKWAKVQLPDGSFPYWPDSTYSNFYVSLRIAHIAALAKEKGIRIPAGFDSAKLMSYLKAEYQRNRVSRYGYGAYTQAYTHYVFALSKESFDASYLAEMLSQRTVDANVLSFIGMTYSKLGRKADAQKVAERLRNLMRQTARGVDITDPNGTSENYWFFGDKVEQLALSLEFFVQMFPDDQINTRLLYSLLENKRAMGGYWSNTAVTVRVLSAIDALIRAENIAKTNITANADISGKQLMSGTFKGLGAKAISKTFDFSGSELASLTRDALQSLVINRKGTGNLYYTATLKYAIPTELQSFRDEGLGIYYMLYDVSTDEEIKSTALVSGKTYRVRIRLSSGRDRTYVALRAPIPSGAEILDASFVTSASHADSNYNYYEENFSSNARESANKNYSWISSQKIYDNEIQYFWDDFGKGEQTVSFLFRAGRRGVYPTPPVQAQCMYEDEVFGRTNGTLYTIE